MECVSETQVLGLLRNTLDAAQRAAVEQHLDACEECLELVTLASKTSLAGALPGPHDAGEAGELAPGTIVGRYEILEPLGQGGMGMVYAARDGQLGRRVAIKLVHPSLAAQPRSQIALLREAQAMARITQPNVLTVYDMGTYEGAVFLAAELVAGDTLEVWLARPRRWREITAVFVQAARGLAAAHAAELVHLDFKPANVLVGADGRVRVFDFGVVRFTDIVTAEREIAGTPLYMAPEQLRGGVADARSDQYAFCVALHEALFGTHPQRRGDAPGVRASDRVPGWLREIVRRGLEPQPARRFPTMTALIAALERGLARRRRWVIAGAAALAVVAVATTALAGYARGRQDSLGSCPDVPSGWDAARKAELARTLRTLGQPYAEAVWQRAARQLDRFAASWRGQRRDACLAFEAQESADRGLYDRRVACLDQHRLVFDAIVERLGKGDLKVDPVNRLLDALPELDVCVRPDEAAWPTSPADRARFAGHFQQVAHVTSLVEAGDYAEAARLIDPLVAAARALGFRRAEADAVYLAGYLAGLRGELAGGARLIEQALWIAEATHYDELVATASSGLLVLVGHQQRRPAEARRFVELARAAAERVGSVTAQARAARAIGNLELVAGRHDAAETELARALALTQTRAAADPLLVADLLHDLATLDFERGNFAAAEPLLRRASELIVAELGDQHPRVTQVLQVLGIVLLELHRERESEAVYRRALALRERAFGPDHPDVARTLGSLTVVYMVDDDLVRAREATDRALAIWERVDPMHVAYATALTNMADLEVRAGKLASAERYHLRAHDIRVKKLGARHQHTTFSTLFLATIALQQRDLAKARRWCDEARASAGAAGPLENRTIPMVEACFGHVELAAGRRAAAIPILERALALHAGNQDHSRVAETQFALAQALPARDRGRALELARAARTGFASEKGFRKLEVEAVDAWLRAYQR